MSEYQQESAVGTPDVSGRSSLTLTDGDIGDLELPGSRHITIQVPNGLTHQEADLEDKDYQTTVNTVNISRIMSHTDQVVDIVENLTRSDRLRQPSRGGVLANLLKLNYGAQRRDRRQRRKHSFYMSRSANPSLVNLHSTPFESKTQSARTSISDVDLFRTAEGPQSVAILADRLRITATVADILQRQNLLLKLAKALIRYGAPSHRIERALEKTSKSLEIEGSFLYLPGVILISFGDTETHTSETHLVKCEQGFDISKLAKVNILTHEIDKSFIEVPEALEQLDSIKKAPPTWNNMSMIGAYAMASCATAPLFFSGSWLDAGVAGVLGLFVGVLALLARRSSTYNNVFDVTTSILVAFVARILHRWICYKAVMLASIVVLLPGYALTNSVMELSSHNVISGAVRMFSSLVYALLLGYGLSIGASIAGAIDGTTPEEVCSNSVPSIWFILLFPLAAIAINITFGASCRQWPAMLFLGGVGYSVSFLCGAYLPNSSQVAPAISAFAIGIVGNLYARLTKQMAFAPIMGGISILVPGSIGVRGALLLLTDPSGNGATFALNCVIIALGITVGLFAATFVVYPTGKKRSVFLGF